MTGDAVRVKDGVVAGDVHVEVTDGSSPSINIQDSAIAGDVTIINQNLDPEALVATIRQEMASFESHGVGFRMPEGGFSRGDIEALIPSLEQDPAPLRDLPSTELLEFGRLLRAMARPRLLNSVANLLIGRPDVEVDATLLAGSHLLRSDAAASLLRTRAARMHALEAVEVARTAGLARLHAAALHAAIRTSKELAEDRASLVREADDLLERIGRRDDLAAAWLHLALGEHHDEGRRGLADHHESMGLDLARKAGDLEAQILATVLSADNTHWVITQHVWDDLRHQSVSHGLSFYGMLIDVADLVRSQQDARLLSSVRTIRRQASDRGLVEMEVMSSLLEMTRGFSKVLEDHAPGSEGMRAALQTVIEDDEHVRAMDEVLTASYLGLDSNLVFFFTLLALHTGSLHEQARAYLAIPRHSTSLSIRSMIRIVDHLGSDGRVDPEILAEIHRDLHQFKVRADDPVWDVFDLAGGSRLTPEELDVFTGLRTSLQDAASPPSNAGFYWTFMAGLGLLFSWPVLMGGVEEIVIGLGMLLMLSSTIGLLLTQVHRAVTSNGIPRFLHSPYTWASVMFLSYLYRWDGGWAIFWISFIAVGWTYHRSRRDGSALSAGQRGDA